MVATNSTNKIIDDIDKQILELLQEDAKITINNIKKFAFILSVGANYFVFSQLSFSTSLVLFLILLQYHPF